MTNIYAYLQFKSVISYFGSFRDEFVKIMNADADQRLSAVISGRFYSLFVTFKKFSIFRKKKFIVLYSVLLPLIIQRFISGNKKH